MILATSMNTIMTISSPYIHSLMQEIFPYSYSVSCHVRIVCMNRNLSGSHGSYITGKAGNQENKCIKKMSDSDKVLLRYLM